MSEMITMFMAIAFVLAACTMARGQQRKYCDSFEDGVPDSFTATRAESLSLSTWHYKQGSNSLRWDWSGGEELVIHHGIGDIARVGGFRTRACFSVWLYVEEPVSDALVFEFREGEKVTGFFRFPLAITGWRQARPYYHDFPHGQPTAEVDNIRIAAPSGVAEGTVFLDFIKYNTLTLGSNSVVPEEEALWRPPVPDEGRFPRPDRVSEAEVAGIRTLLGPDEGPGIEQARVDDLCERVEALGIVRDEHGVRGPGIDAHYQYHPSDEEREAKGFEDGGYWSDEHGPNWFGMQDPRSMTSLARRVAGGYRASNDVAQRRRLADAFLLISDHLHDQVFQAGSGFKWNWWVGGAWAEAVFLMRDMLAEAGRLQRHLDFLLYTYGADAIFAEGDAPSHMDFYHLTVPCLLRQCLMQVEATEQVRWLNAFKAMLEQSMLQPTSALKIDGCTYHHAGHYFHYAFGAVPGLASTVQELSGTPWRLGPEAHERIRRAALAQRIFCNRLDVPLSLRGRMPFVDYSLRILPKGLDALARSGTPDGKQEIDPEVAAAYLRLVPEAADDEPYRSLGIVPEPEPNGTFVMPYGALLSHRRDNWLASVHGQSKYVWGSERQAQCNCYGLFQGLGHLEILGGGTPVSAEASGRRHHGWDWRRFEGITVPQLPLEMIDEAWRSYSHPYSPETFVGGLSYRGRQGLFAMILNQPMAENTTLAGRKSWFFSDDQVLCLGSDIACDEARYPTQTTLCQKALRADGGGELLPAMLDGADLTAFPEERTLDEADAHWFLDVQQTGVYLPAGQRVTVARTRQVSRDYLDQEDTEGDFLTAWIDHGKAPSAASYEYMLVVRATPEVMQRLAAEPPYRVVQCDRSAHIVRHSAGGRWSCVLFAGQEVAAHEDATETLPIKAVDRPCLIMAETSPDGRLKLSVADPDLNLEEGVNQPRALRVTLRGAWRVLEATGTVCAWPLPDAGKDVRIVPAGEEETVLEILCRHGASYDLSLTGR